MPSLLILHPSLAHDPLDLPLARLASGLADKAEVRLLLPGGLDDRTPAAAALSRRVQVEVGKGGRRPMLGALPALVARLKAAAPDFVLASGNDAGWLAAAARIAAGRPGRLLVKLDRPLPRQNPLARRFQQTVFAEAARVLVPSDADRRRLSALFPAAAQRFGAVAEALVPDTGRSPPPPRRKGDARSLLAAGTIDRDARFELLVDALPLTEADTRLTIVGAGPHGDRLLAHAAARGVRERVEIVAGDLLGPHLRDAELYLLANARESMPPHLIEALAADRGVIATDSFAAARDLLDGTPGCAVLRRPDPQLLANAIDAQLRAGPRPSLRPVAERHGVAASVQAHAWAMGML